MPATATVSVSDAMLKTMRWSGFGPRAHRALRPCTHRRDADGVAGPRANSAQKFTACESDSSTGCGQRQLDLNADVTTATARRAPNSSGLSRVD